MTEQSSTPPQAPWTSDPSTGEYAVPHAPSPKRRRARAAAAALAAAAVAGISGYSVGHVTADTGEPTSQVSDDAGAT